MYIRSHRNGITQLRKASALVIVFFILFSYLCAPIQAAISSTITHTTEENLAILEALKELYGDDVKAEEAFSELSRLGLLDEDGNPVTTATVNVDGQQLTLEQVRELVFSDGVDYSKIVSIDGTPVTLGDLKIMIEIEDEIQRIKETYFTDVTLNQEQQAALKSLKQQISSEGIMMMGADVTTPDFPSGIEHSIYAYIDTTPIATVNGASEHSFTITLKDGNGDQLAVVPDYNISVSYRILDGSAKKGINYNADDGTILFMPGSDQTAQTVSFSILQDTSRFEGQKSFVIQFYDPQNTLFVGGKKALEKMVTIQNNYTWSVVKQFASGDAVNEVEDIADEALVVSWQTDYNALMQCDLFEEGLYDRVRLHVSGPISITDAPENVAAPEYIRFQNQFGWPDYYPISFPDFIPDTCLLPYNRTLNYSGDVLYNSAMLDYIMTTEADPEFPEHGHFWVILPGSYYGELSFHYTMTFLDSIAPTVKSVNIPEGVTYEYGQSVPISVEYSEPVDLSGATLTANGQVLTPAESASKSRLATYLYPVKQQDSASLVISSIAGANDLYGNAQLADETTRTTTGIIQGIDKSNALTSANGVASLNAGKTGMNVHVTINLTDPVPDWLINEASGNGGMVPSIRASADGGLTMVNLFVDSDNPTYLEGDFDQDINSSGETRYMTMEFYMDPVLGSASNFELILGKYAVLGVPPVTFLTEEDFSISYGDFPESGIVFAEDGSSPKLGIAVLNGLNATWMDPAKDFLWSSNNPDIAGIDSNGVISLTGKSGTATFTLTAKNGEIEDKSISVTSNPLTVKVGLTPFLKIPTGTNVVFIKSSESAEVRWISNLIGKNAETDNDTNFRIRVYRADYTSGSLARGALTYDQTISSNAASPISSHFIPSDMLTEISVIGRHSYIAEVSSKDPVTQELLTAEAYITVLSQPAIAKIGKLNTYFITDNTAQVPVSWTLQHFDSLNEAEFKLEIINNANGSVVYQQTSSENSGGSCLFSVPKVANGFKDI